MACSLMYFASNHFVSSATRVEFERWILLFAGNDHAKFQFHRNILSAVVDVRSNDSDILHMSLCLVLSNKQATILYLIISVRHTVLSTHLNSPFENNMGNDCLLDLFSVEIVDILLTYFCTHEILLSLTGISDYIDGILSDYSTWKLNFRSIRKDHFDLICRRIQPNKVISLTLSDENDTPGQSELFFSRFQIEQFTRLQSITLVKIEVESIKNIFSNLYKLEQLRSLSFESDSIISKYPPSCDGIFQGRHRQWYSIVLDSYRQILPNLTRLRLSHVFNLADISFSQLRQLKLTRCSQDELRQVIQSAPHLQSLSVGLELDQPNMKITIASSQLTRLRLTIQSEYFHCY